MLIIKILIIVLTPILLIVGIVAGLWYLTLNIWATVFIPIAVLSLYSLLKNLISFLKLKKIQNNLLPEVKILTIEGFLFRDLNRNGKLDVYEDSRQPKNKRINDLLNQMTIEEKIGLMFSPMMRAGKKGKLQEKKTLFSKFGTSDIISRKMINTFATFASGSPTEFVKWHNAFQKVAERTRLGIPITLCSDPRHEYVESDNPLANLADTNVSKWPNPLGLAATNDVALVERFGDIARQELKSLGIRFALHPMADLATEPRWSRI